jgi:hypothetical protein
MHVRCEPHAGRHGVVAFVVAQRVLDARRMKTPRFFAVLAALAVTLCAAGRAHACWDGYSATVHRVTFNIQGDTNWSTENARTAALWGTRIDALLPQGKRLEAWSTFAMLCTTTADDECTTYVEIKWSEPRFSELFRKVATATGASRATIAHAGALGAAPLTLQAFAAYDAARANAFATRINEVAGDGLNGFFQAGGFPAMNPSAHVLDGVDARGVKIYRVMVGAFLSQTDADVARTQLEELAGVQAFGRPL